MRPLIPAPRLALGAIVAAALLGTVAAATPASEGWKMFVSQAGHYTASYPPSWHVLPPPGPLLDIVSFPPSRRWRGDIIPAGGARIVVVPAPGGSTIEQWMKSRKRGGKQISANATTVRRSSGENLSVIEVASEWREGSEESVEYYFQLASHFFVADLTYWKGDPKAQAYQSVLRGVVERLVVTRKRR